MKKLSKLIWFFRRIEINVEVLLTIIGLLISYLSFFIALPFFYEYKANNNIPDMNWNWSVEFTTEETSYDKYKWMVLKYNMFFLWNKNIYKWTWEKVQIWDTYLVWNQRDRTEMDLIVKWNQIYGTYYLFWKKRDTDGNFKLKLSDDATMFQGTFIWNAADSKWVVTWIKLN